MVRSNLLECFGFPVYDCRKKFSIDVLEGMILLGPFYSNEPLLEHKFKLEAQGWFPKENLT